MFVMTLNKGGLKKLAAVGVCALALAAGALGLRMLDKGGEAVDTAAVPTSALNQKINGAEDVKAFLAGYGLEVDPTTAEVTAVQVPRKWDDSFKAVSYTHLGRAKRSRFFGVFAGKRAGEACWKGKKRLLFRYFCSETGRRCIPEG